MVVRCSVDFLFYHLYPHAALGQGKCTTVHLLLMPSCADRDLWFAVCGTAGLALSPERAKTAETPGKGCLSVQAAEDKQFLLKGAGQQPQVGEQLQGCTYDTTETAKLMPMPVFASSMAQSERLDCRLIFSPLPGSGCCRV